MRLSHLAFWVWVLWPGAADATFSVVAVDPVTREVGVGAATCTVGVENIRGLVPGRGALVAQAQTDLASHDAGIEALQRGASAAEVLRAAEAAAGEGWVGGPWPTQQFAVATLDPEPATAVHTGVEAGPFAGSLGGPGVSVQGNLLVGIEVLHGALDAFRSRERPLGDERCTPSLAERIVRALEAGAQAGGDKRCQPERAALTAFVAVAPAEGEPLLLVEPRSYGLAAAVWNLALPYEPGPEVPPVLDGLRHKLDALGRVARCRATRPSSRRRRAVPPRSRRLTRGRPGTARPSPAPPVGPAAPAG